MFDISEGLANGLYSTFNVMGIIGAALAFIGVLGTVWTSSVREKYGDIRISNNERLTADANAQAAKANEGLAKANLEIENRKKENLELRLLLEKAAADDAEHRKEIANLNSKQNETDKKLKPKPRNARIREILEAASPEILPAIRRGTLVIKRSMKQEYVEALQKISKEPGAANLVIFQPIKNTTVSPTGTESDVEFKVDPDILRDDSTP